MAYEAPKDYIDVATRITEFRAHHPHGTLQPWNPAEPFRLVQVEGTKKDGQRTEQTFIVVVAAAYRTPDDPRPGIGMAWEVFPGRTPYTLGSELMNAETSAWGRAIIAVGAADAKRGIASAEEVRNRAAERDSGAGDPYEDGDMAGANKGSDWRPPANPRTRKAVRHNGRNGPLPDDEWTAAPGGLDETVACTSTPDQWQLIAIKLTEKGIDTREGKLAFCTQSAGRPVGSSKELSYLEAAEIIRRAEQLPATPGPLAEKVT
jgi:hypothetical protein